MPYKRICPSCSAELHYANLAGYQRATRSKALCRKCAASPAVIQKRLAEAQEKAAKKGDGNFLSAFFESVDLSLSGSRGRK